MNAQNSDKLQEMMLIHTKSDGKISKRLRSTLFVIHLSVSLLDLHMSTIPGHPGPNRETLDA
ncbi:hypothetical protein C942_00873 [Photobacterium marinum]|uniref:Uncharacterized protein n=1 Tax=Photobacterium marinum TaxID=1056511 RepID=L8JEG4_9GAMM|nr:hypothetical protein C942_00873 [Photobacterium marinum]